MLGSEWQSDVPRRNTSWNCHIPRHQEKTDSQLVSMDCMMSSLALVWCIVIRILRLVAGVFIMSRLKPCPIA